MVSVTALIAGFLVGGVVYLITEPKIFKQNDIPLFITQAFVGAGILAVFHQNINVHYREPFLLNTEILWQVFAGYVFGLIQIPLTFIIPFAYYIFINRNTDPDSIYQTIIVMVLKLLAIPLFFGLLLVSGLASGQTFTGHQTAFVTILFLAAISYFRYRHLLSEYINAPRELPWGHILSNLIVHALVVPPALIVVLAEFPRMDSGGDVGVIAAGIVFAGVHRYSTGRSVTAFGRSLGATVTFLMMGLSGYMILLGSAVLVLEYLSVAGFLNINSNTSRLIEIVGIGIVLFATSAITNRWLSTRSGGSATTATSRDERRSEDTAAQSKRSSKSELESAQRTRQTAGDINTRRPDEDS